MISFSSSSSSRSSSFVLTGSSFLLEEISDISSILASSSTPASSAFSFISSTSSLISFVYLMIPSSIESYASLRNSLVAGVSGAGVLSWNSAIFTDSTDSTLIVPPIGTPASWSSVIFSAIVYSS